MLIYELTLTIEDEWFDAVSAHAQLTVLDMLDTDCFAGITLESTAGCLRIRAKAADQALLDRYLDVFAPDLRADFLEHFPVGVHIERAVWQLLGEHDNHDQAESI